MFFTPPSEAQVRSQILSKYTPVGTSVQDCRKIILERIKINKGVTGFSGKMAADPGPVGMAPLSNPELLPGFPDCQLSLYGDQFGHLGPYELYIHWVFDENWLLKDVQVEIWQEFL